MRRYFLEIVSKSHPFIEKKTGPEIQNRLEKNQ